LPSIINVFQRMNVPVDPETPLPAKAVAPQKWSIFSLWVHTPEERDVQFTQHTEVFDAAGDKFVESANQFKITDSDDLQSKNHLDILGMPIGPEGFVKIRVWLEGVADTTGEYQFAIKHVAKDFVHGQYQNVN